jgi:predicted transport protein
MIFSFFKKLIKYYVDKFIHWLRMQKFNLELDNEIKKYFEELDKKDEKQKKPEIKEVGTFGEEGWSISIGDIEDGNTRN